MRWINGVIIKGHGVASGRATECPFPGGSIRMQQPFFMTQGIDLSPYYAGTLNVDIAPLVPFVSWAPTSSNVVFDSRVRWMENLEERFVLTSIAIEVKAMRYTGLWYYPHPDTKIDHFQPASVIELLLPWIDGLAIDDTIQIGC